MRKLILLVILNLLIGHPSMTTAAPVAFIETYMYDAGEADSKLTCRAISLVQAKKLLLEKLGMYLEAETEVVNYQLTREQITSLTAGIVKTEIISETWDGKTYTLTAKIEADPANVARSIDTLRQSREGRDTMTKMETANAQSLAKIEELKEEMTNVQNNVISITRDYQQSIKIVDAWQAYENASQLMTQGRYTEALAAFNKAIEVKPTFMHYFNRGKAYVKLENPNKAIEDFSRAIDLNPEFSNAYFHRGKLLRKAGRKKRGDQDIKKAAELGNGQAKQWLKHRRTYLFSP